MTATRELCFARTSLFLNTSSRKSMWVVRMKYYRRGFSPHPGQFIDGVLQRTASGEKKWGGLGEMADARPYGIGER